jgi:hypothetical protein
MYLLKCLNCHGIYPWIEDIDIFLALKCDYQLNLGFFSIGYTYFWSTTFETTTQLKISENYKVFF